MFQKLRTSRYIKASGCNDAAVVASTGKVQRIARIHQYGLKDRPNPHSSDVVYPERQLLGFRQTDKPPIEELVEKYLN